MNIYSRIEPTKLLHIIVRKQDIPVGRVNIVPEDQFLQCASLRLAKGTTFKAHKHNWNEVSGERVCQESWIVLKGRVKVILYDIDDTILHTDILEAGEASFTLGAAHNYFIMEDDTRVMEYKTGPYEGQEKDKTLI